MSIYIKYAPYGTKIVVLYYVDDCVYWYISEALGKWFMDNPGKIFHMKFLGYAHWFMLIRISQMKYHSISVYKARYSTSIVTKYLDNSTVKASTKIYKTTFLYDIMFTKDDVSTSDEQVGNLTGEFNINCRACIGPFIYLLSKKVDFNVAVHKLSKFSSSPGTVNFEGLVNCLRYIRDNKILGLNYSADMKDETLSDLLRQVSINTENHLMAFYDSI